MENVSNTTQIQLRTTLDNRAWLKEKAQEQDRSVNWLINKILADAKAADSEKKDATH